MTPKISRYPLNTETSIDLTHKPYNWRLLGILVLAILVSVILITPYSLAIQADSLKSAKLPLPLPLLLPIQWVETTILYGIIAAIGLAVAGRIGLGLPFMAALPKRSCSDCSCCRCSPGLADP